MSHDQRSAHARSRDSASAKKTHTSRSLCSSAIPRTTLPATDIPTTPGPPRKNATTRSRMSWCSEGKELDSTADVQPDAGDVAREVGAQEGDCVGDVQRLACLAKRGPANHALVHFRVAEV